MTKNKDICLNCAQPVSLVLGLAWIHVETGAMTCAQPNAPRPWPMSHFPKAIPANGTIIITEEYSCPWWQIRTTVYCLRCGLQYFKNGTWCQCPEPENTDCLTQVPHGIALTTQEQKL